MLNKNDANDDEKGNPMMKSDTPKFALVPVEPTIEMWDAASHLVLFGKQRIFGWFLKKGVVEIYRAMISAAPKPDCVGVEEIEGLDDALEYFNFTHDAADPPRKEPYYIRQEERHRLTAVLQAARAYQKLLAVKEKAQERDEP